MRLFQWTVLGLALVTFFACTEALKPGRCNQTSDCVAMSAYGAGYVCNLDFNQQGDGRCVPRCQSSSECTGGRICDADGQGVGRCLFPETPDGGGGDGGGDDGGGVDGDAGDGAPHCPVCQGSTPVCVGVTCVECAGSADCKSDPTKPICDTTAHTCGPCSSDDQCAAKLGAAPGVCMAHQDGRCATDAEAIYVDPTNTTTCTSILLSGTDGTSARPFCALDLARRLLNGDGTLPPSTRTLLIVRGGPMDAAAGPFTRGSGGEVSIIGQNTAVIAAGAKPGLELQAGAFYVRGLKISPSASIGIKATPGASDTLTLRLDHVTVDSCQGGGIFLGGAAFDIRNTVVTRSGPSADLAWGGIRVDVLPTAGPAQLNLVTVQNNNAAGISCAPGAAIAQSMGVFAANNAAGDIAATCGITGCSPISSMCGAP